MDRNGYLISSSRESWQGKKMYSFHTQVLADYPSWAKSGFQVICNCFRVIGLEASGFVFSMVSLCFLMRALATYQIEQRSKDLYRSIYEGRELAVSPY